MNVILKIT